MKKLLCMVLCLCMLLAVMAGCSSGTTAITEPSAEPESSQQTAQESSAPQQEEAEAPEEAEPVEEEPQVEESKGELITVGDFTYEYTEIPLPLTEEPVTMTLITDFLPPLFAAMSGMEENSVYIELEKRTGIHLDITSVATSEMSTSVSLTVASGEYPDFWFAFLNAYSSTVDSAVDDEIVIDLAQYKEYMPNYFSLIDSNDSLKKNTYTDQGYMGQTYGIFEQPLATQGLCIRQDWLDDLGLATPVTFDDYYEVLTAFHDNFGAVYWMNSGGEQYFSAGYDTSASYLQKDGQVYFGAITDEYRQYLEMMNKWYSEGLIWQEFTTSSDAMDETKAAAGEYGLFDLTLSKYTNVVTHADDPDFLLSAVIPAVKNAGDKLHVGQEMSAIANKGISLTTHCPDEYLEIACKWLDYWFTPDGSMLANYGVEGEAYTLVDGEVVWTDLMLNNPDLNYTWAMNKYCMGSGPFIINGTRIYNDYDDNQWEMMDVFNGDYNDYAYALPTVSLTAEESEEYTTLYSDINTYISEHYLLFINGDMSFDQFDEFVAQIKTLGIDRCVELQQQAYDRYMAR